MDRTMSRTLPLVTRSFAFLLLTAGLAPVPARSAEDADAIRSLIETLQTERDSRGYETAIKLAEAKGAQPLTVDFYDEMPDVEITLSKSREAQEAGPTTGADDLPAEFKVLLGTEAAHDYRWTLIGKNEKAQEQEQLHPELNAFRAIWHSPLARDSSVFKFEFTRPIRKGGTVFHLYVKADGDVNTGRKHDSIHNGVDYMLTVIDGDPQHTNSRLDVFEADGKTRRGTCNILIQGKSLYLAAGMALQQQDGHSVFEYSVSSYVKNNGPSISSRLTGTTCPTIRPIRIKYGPCP
jgi:hypothetical protein